MTATNPLARRASEAAPLRSVAMQDLSAQQAHAYRTLPSDDPEGGAHGRSRSDKASPPAREDLSIALEVWDEGETTLESVLAVTNNPVVGYAMFHAAIKHYRDARIILRRNGLVISRWSGVTH